MGVIFSLVIIVLIFSFVVLEVTSVRRSHGAWRWFALLPGIAIVIVVLNIIIGTLIDRTSHNLWPFEIIIWSAGGLVYLGVFWLVRKVVEK